MISIRVKREEPFENALRRFKRKCKKERILHETKRSRFYVKPSERKREKALEARARASQHYD